MIPSKSSDKLHLIIEYIKELDLSLLKSVEITWDCIQFDDDTKIVLPNLKIELKNNENNIDNPNTGK